MYNIIRLVWNSGECYLKLLVLLKETVIFFGQSFGLFLHGVQIWVWRFQSCRKANRRGSFVCNLFSRMSEECLCGLCSPSVLLLSSSVSLCTSLFSSLFSSGSCLFPPSPLLSVSAWGWQQFVLLLLKRL